MSEANKALVQRWFEEVWNKGRAEAIEEMFAADGIAHGLGDTVLDPGAYREFYTSFRGAFPDIVVTVEDMVAEGDKVAARCRVSAKHTGYSGFCRDPFSGGVYGYHDCQNCKWQDC